jgi:hypothetical protein
MFRGRKRDNCLHPAGKLKLVGEIGWLKVLKVDTRAIVTLSSQASQVADWLLNRGKEEKVEQPPVEDAIPY